MFADEAEDRIVNESINEVHDFPPQFKDIPTLAEIFDVHMNQLVFNFFPDMNGRYRVTHIYDDFFVIKKLGSSREFRVLFKDLEYTLNEGKLSLARRNNKPIFVRRRFKYFGSYIEYQGGSKDDKYSNFT